MIVLIPKHLQRSKLAQTGFKVFLVGLANDFSTYQVFNASTKKVVISANVWFLENDFAGTKHAQTNSDPLPELEFVQSPDAFKVFDQDENPIQQDNNPLQPKHAETSNPDSIDCSLNSPDHFPSESLPATNPNSSEFEISPRNILDHPRRLNSQLYLVDADYEDP